MYLYVWFPILLIYALLGPSQFVTSVSPTVTISSGVVVGISTAVHKVVVNKYLGIPFAASPPKRFSPPEPPEPWSTPFSAVSFKDTCIQQFN
ncbi:hypothetical protein MMC19_000926, partial [Ptychographa xylographoides]|nr:hypothetical protein [Ptychographa xylographoides]